MPIYKRRHIPGLKKFYKADTNGNIWSCRKKGVYWRTDEWRKLKPSIQKWGHLTVVLYVNGKRISTGVSRLVLLAFKGPCPEGMEARHYPDRDPANNRPDNLSWSTHTKNMGDKKTHGTTPKGNVVNLKNRIQNTDQIRRMKRLFKKGKYTRKELASLFGYSIYYTRRLLQGNARLKG
jgi:hypothetical protein